MTSRPPADSAIPHALLTLLIAGQPSGTGELASERIAIGCGARRFACARRGASEPPCATWQTRSKTARTRLATNSFIRRLLMVFRLIAIAVVYLVAFAGW